MELLERVDLLADADELDRRAGHRAHGERRAAAGVAVHPGQHDAGDAERLVEGLGGVDRVLAGHRVDDEQRLGRVGRGADGSRTSSISAWLIESRPAVSRMTMSNPSRRPVSMARRAISTGVWPWHDRQARHAGPLGQLCELELRGRALRVEAGQQHPAAQPLMQAERELAGGGGLARALQPDHQHGDRRRGIEVERHRSRPAQLLDHHVVDDLHDLLAGADAVEHLGPERPLPDLADEVADHGQGHVGIEQREADLAQCLIRRRSR